MSNSRRALLTGLLATGATALAGCSLLPRRKPTDQETPTPPKWALRLADVPGATNLEVWNRLPFLTAGHNVEWVLNKMRNLYLFEGPPTVVYSAGEAKVYETMLVTTPGSDPRERLDQLAEAVAASDGTTTDHIKLDMVRGSDGYERISTTKDLTPPLYGFTSWVTREDGSHGVIELVYAPTITKEGGLVLVVLTTVSDGRAALEPHSLDLLPTALERAGVSVVPADPTPSPS